MKISRKIGMKDFDLKFVIKKWGIPPRLCWLEKYKFGI